jgi:hypothetical protein
MIVYQRLEFSVGGHSNSMLSRYCLVVLLFLLIIVNPLSAQDDEAEAETGVAYGGRISGQINNQTPRAVYYFDGLRGEVVSINLAATGGDLDPVLMVMDTAGNVIANQDDSRGTRDIAIDALSIPQSSRYYVIVGRFGYGLGSTSGGFDLDVERIGVSSASGSALRYGDSVINNITNMTPQVYYSFRANQGDIVNIKMIHDSGDLDPYLQVVNSNAFVIADNDDVPGSGLAAELNRLVIETDGTYIIVATRYGESAGTSTGRFILTLEEAQGSGLGNSAQTAIPLQVGSSKEDTISSDEFERYYVFDARQNDLITARMTRSTGSLDAFLIIADANLQELTSNDDTGSSQNAAIESFVIPADGRYYLIATRLDRSEGTTSGGYKLDFQSLGNAFDGVPTEAQRISYGTTLTGRIDDQTPQVLYAFHGLEGEAITVSVNRGDGDLDPVVEILGSDQVALVSDDDSGGGQNARIARYVLPSTGLYFIRAGRFSGDAEGNPNTRGSYILVLAQIVR